VDSTNHPERTDITYNYEEKQRVGNSNNSMEKPSHSDI